MNTMLNMRLLLPVLLAFISGCGGTRAGKLAWNDPDAAAAKAVETYDRNTDGRLSSDESKASPALEASVRRLDRNRDGQLAADEIAARFEELHRLVKYVGLDVSATSKGQPVVGASITLTPEPFMGDDFPTFSGTVLESGSCPLADDGRDLLGVPVGFYTLKVVHAGKETVRGVEIATDTTGSRLEITL